MSTPHLIDYTITVSGSEILKNENTSLSGSSDSESSSSLESSSLTEEELSEISDSIMSQGTSGSVVAGVSLTVVEPDKASGGMPAIAVVGISAALGAAVAFVAVTVGKKKK